MITWNILRIWIDQISFVIQSTDKYLNTKTTLAIWKRHHGQEELSISAIHPDNRERRSTMLIKITERQCKQRVVGYQTGLQSEKPPFYVIKKPRDLFEIIKEHLPFVEIDDYADPPCPVCRLHILPNYEIFTKGTIKYHKDCWEAKQQKKSE